MALPGGRLTRAALALLVCGISACGDSSGGSSSELIVEPQDETRTVGVNVAYGAVALTPLGSGDFLLVRTETEDDNPTDEDTGQQSIVTERFDADLASIGEGSVDAGPSPHFLSWVSACSSNGKIAASWTDFTPHKQLPFGITLDTQNVEAVRLDDDSNPLGSFTVNENLIGEQRQSHIACLSDGSLAITWTSQCIAVNRLGDISFALFTPEECNTEPVNGAYLQRFDANGDPEGPMQLVAGANQSDWSSSEPAIASLPHGRVLVVTGNLARVYDENGTTNDETAIPSGSYAPLLSCSHDRCTILTSGLSGPITATVVDPDDLSDAVEIEVKAPVVEIDEPEHTVTVEPQRPNLACDAAGTCLITWRLARESWFTDYGNTEELGIYAVAIDARSGRLGFEQLLVAAPLIGFNESTTVTTAVSDGKFVTARNTDGVVILDRVDVR